MKEKCTVKDGKFVEPCDSLKDMAEHGHPPKGKSRGIFAWVYTNLKTHTPSRTFFGAKSTSQPNGLAFNFCPWCGEQIHAPLYANTAGSHSAKESSHEKL